MSESFFLFFKQKTAYEMRISDWSSDVCSSDLLNRNNSSDRQPGPCVTSSLASVLNSGQPCSTSFLRSPNEHEQPTVQAVRRSIVLRRYAERDKIGRASCRERVCQYV